MVFQSLADQFEGGADDDGIDHDDSIFLVRTDGTELHRLPPGDLVGSEVRPTWSPDGQRIVFVRGHLPNEGGELWAIDADGSDAQLLYACETTCNSVDYPDWGPDGGIYVQRDSNVPPGGGLPTTFEIWRYDLATGEARSVLTREDGMSVEQVRLSPDGKRVVYVRYRDIEADASSALFVSDLEGGPERQLTEWELHAAYPDWSVTDRIVFNSFDLRIYPDTTEAANLYDIAADGSDLRQLTRHGRDDHRATQPRWTQDGLGIVYTLVTTVQQDNFGERHLAYMDVAGTDQRLLTLDLIGTHPEPQPGITAG